MLDLFSGIGGFSLGLERTGGFKTVAFCEIEPFCQRVLAKHWPGVPCYGDIRELTAERLRADGVVPDVLCGGFPCQDISRAGRMEGIDGAQSGLWAEYARLLGELQPRFAIVENSTNILAGPTEQPGGWFGRVLGDLAALGYDAEWHCIPAAAVGAVHIRDRAWIVAYSDRARRAEGICAPDRSSWRETWRSEPERLGCGVPDPDGPRLAIWESLGGYDGEECAPAFGADWWAVEPDVVRVVHGFSSRAHRVRALGNAVVPQIPEIIGRAILAAEGRA